MSMKFVSGPLGNWVEVRTDPPAEDASWWQSIWNSLNDGTDYLLEKEVELLLKPLGLFLQKCAVMLWHWFLTNLPDIMGYGAILTGVCIILGSMIGKGGMMKPIAIYSGFFIIALLLLGGAK